MMQTFRYFYEKTTIATNQVRPDRWFLEVSLLHGQSSARERLAFALGEKNYTAACLKPAVKFTPGLTPDRGIAFLPQARPAQTLELVVYNENYQQYLSHCTWFTNGAQVLNPSNNQGLPWRSHQLSAGLSLAHTAIGREAQIAAGDCRSAKAENSWLYAPRNCKDGGLIAEDCTWYLSGISKSMSPPNCSNRGHLPLHWGEVILHKKWHEAPCWKRGSSIQFGNIEELSCG